MSITVHWRAAEQRTHLATPGNHRALCGADVLNAPVIDQADGNDACRLCTEHAWRYGIDTPPATKPAQRDHNTRALEFGA